MVTSTTVTVVEVTRFLFFFIICWCASAHPFPICFHLFANVDEKEEACFRAVSWICMASVGELAQAPVSDLFPLVSDRAGVKKVSVFWSRKVDLRGQCG